MAFSKFFYPRLVYNAITIDFVDPVSVIAVDEIPIRGQNASIAGLTETLFERMELRVTLNFVHVNNTITAALRTYWTNWGSLGKQAALTFDRLSTCAGQYEYDQFNTAFTKAELLNSPWAPRRSMTGRALYAMQLVFRQGYS